MGIPIAGRESGSLSDKQANIFGNWLFPFATLQSTCNVSANISYISASYNHCPTGGKENLIDQATHVLAGVASSYHGQVKAARGSAGPLPELHFFYEGHRVTTLLHSRFLSDSLRNL
jgi:hypothetical protein